MNKSFFILLLVTFCGLQSYAQTCSKCGGAGANNSLGNQSGPSLHISLGSVQYGKPAGNLAFSSSLPNANLYTPQALEYDSAWSGQVVVVSNADWSLRQVNAPQALADIPSPPTTNGYIINFYYPSQVGSTNGYGVYALSGNPYITWTITNISPSSINQVQISENASNQILKQWTYTYTSATGAWAMQTLGGVLEEMISTNLSTNTFEVINTLQCTNGPIASFVAKTYQTFYWSQSTNTALVQVASGSGSAQELTSYSYWDPATFGAGSFILPATISHPDGSWQWYVGYTTNGDPTNVWSSFGNITLAYATNNAGGGARQTIYVYDPVAAGVSGAGDNGTANPDTARLTIQMLQGQEVSRQYTVFPSVTERLNIQCTVPGAAWNASGNLTTTNFFYGSGPNQFALQSVIYPNATMAYYNYITNGLYETNEIVTGQPDPTFNYIVDGTSNELVMNQFGYNVLNASWDVLSQNMLSEDVYGNDDYYGRPQQVTHLDGTTEYTVYTCCGLEETMDKDAVSTVYLYDPDERQVGYTKIYSGGTSNAVTYKNILDAAGRTVQSYRIGSDNSVIMMSQSAYDTAGEIIYDTNALNGVTIYSRTNNAITGGWIRTLTNPDGGTRIETNYADGSLESLAGTGVHGLIYVYGIASDINGNRCTTTGQIKLNANGSNSAESTTNFTDMAGRTTEVLYADGHYSQSFYNTRGQLWKQIDPDGVTMLYQYNAKDDLTVTAISVAGPSATSPNFGGSDRITAVTNYVTMDYGTAVLRVDNYAWLNNGSSASTLISKSETSVAGTDTWQTAYRDTSTPVVSHIHTVLGPSRAVTTTMPDDSYTRDSYSYSLLLSRNKYDSANNQINGTSFGYDPHLRQSTVTDARDGTTTYAFNNADQIVTNTTANQGTGSEITTTLYDQLLRPYSVIQPDNTTVTNVYLLTGELGLQYGSRTYPVGYSYDYAGRMKSMTNWSGFNTLTGARVTTWNYDGGRGWLTNKVYDGNAAGPSYQYTSAGRLYKRAWARGVTTTYGYDFGGLLNSVAYSDSTPGVTTTFDRLGRKSTAVWNGITDTTSYNLANQLTCESYSGGFLGGLVVTNVYDSDLRRSSLSTLSGTTPLSSASYSYDNASRLLSVADASNNSANYTYLAYSPLLSQITYKQNGTTRMTTAKQYDYLNRLTQISSSPSASYVSPLTYNYNYNPANQRTKDTLADGSYWIYGYDSLGQVTNACKYWANGSPIAGQQFDYTFDTIGNRTQTQAGGDTNGLNLRVANYYANNLNQLTNRDIPPFADVIGASVLTNSVTVNGQTAYRNQEYFRQQVPANNTNSALWTNIIASGGQSVTGCVYVPQEPETLKYDLDGNLTNDGRWQYVWDGENRLIQMTNSSGIGPNYNLLFAYDSQGRRILKVVSTNNVGIYTNNCLYDSWNLIATLSPSSSLINSFIWGSDLSGSTLGAGGVGGLLEMSYYGTTTTNCFPAYDGNGNLTALINSADGTLAANYAYGPFGEVIRSTGPMAKANPFRWSTEYQDDESDILMYPHRPYIASTGRWLSRDPIEESGGPNLYGFVGNSPINYVDPFGQMRWGDLERIRDAADAAVKNQTCCCGKSVVQATISGTASGQQVTDTINLNIQGGCVGILQYYWWDCFSAQQEYGNDNSPNKPPGQQAWQDYGWHLGSNPQTQSHKGTPGWVPFDWNDGNHWNWQAAVLYLHCASGHFRVDLQLSNALEWTWVNGGWGDSHDGSGGKL